MNKLSTRLLTAALAVGVVGSAAAQDYGRYDTYRDRGYPSSGTYEYARVVRADPILVQVRGPRETTERCYERPAGEYVDNGYRGDGYYNGGYRGSDGGRSAATVVGGIAGALLGSRVGGGNGRFVGTAVGTMVGGLAGRSIYDSNSRSTVQTGSVRVCEPVAYRSESYDRVDGYDVTYEYGGRYYHTRSAQRPGDRIRVRVDVLPD
ncbi:glycine zipper 2TM domain-containing protein [Xanthomonas graminis]|uniref:glycine zipper 2TM domain-containing protein n=1 Tax=Xanthomonas graminis TaxID=3390026 RepID=UPI001F004D66|nr:glycine zipper 2TM domain-containing protein [Xanthomonas translucens]UKE72097.1 glycine zipper 2TM domain-containing protein [Xanthomonas translucens pv. phleipratensis]